ncbi:MAG: YbjQ family protein [Halobacteriales archaeon]
MELTTTETVPGREVESSLGIVKGNTVRARNVGRDLTQSIRNIAGGELKSYTGLLSDAREEALERLADAAEAEGADAVVNVRFETSEIAQGSAEILAYGTAVTLA